ncbi:MAG: stalk domain-containing protein [Desulfotomaculaceae bacterium]|nr:stalk domain-containing protein [Desulfotomaculaceae bacterium]
MLILSHRYVIILTISLLILSIVLSPCKAMAGEALDLSLNVQVNRCQVIFPDAGPFIDENGRTQAPARFVAQALGAEVNWNSGVATFSRNGKEIMLVPGGLTATINGAPVELDSGTVLIEDRIYTPVRFIAETLGAVVQWDAATRTVQITTDQPVIKNFGITHTKLDAGWYTIPRAFTACVEADNTHKVDFYLTPTGTGQIPVKIATSYGNGGQFSITYRLPQASIMAHFWAVAINERGEQSTDILNVYRDAATRTVQITTDQPVIKNFGITHTKLDAGWYTIPRAFTACVEADNTHKVDFYLTPTGTGQIPVKIATSYGNGGQFSITYRLPQASIMAHFWAVAINERGEQSTDILNVYRDAADDTERKSIGFRELSLNGYNQDLLFRPGRGMAVFSGYCYQDEENTGKNSKLLLLDLAVGAVNIMDEGEFIRTIGWDSAGENLLYIKDGSLYRMSMIDGRKNIIAENTYYGCYSPDGQRIAYAQTNNGLWVCDLYGNNKKRLTKTTQDWYPVWYPDGQHLFYFSDLGQELGDGAGHLQGMAKISVSDGSIEAILPQKTGKFRSAEWLVPGRSLHVVSGWDDGYYQHIVDLTEGNITDLGENFGRINYVTALDPAAGRLLKASSDGIRFFDGSGNVEPYNDYRFDNRVYLSAAFTPDGRIVMMTSKTLAEGQQVQKEIAVLDPKSESYDVVAEGGENFEACFWEPGSGQILILEKSADGTSYELDCFTRISLTGGINTST